jgi:cyclopropane-fatty-acyl-phospholipid synthase
VAQSASHKLVESILSLADIRINGSRPWDMQVHNAAMFNRIIKNYSLGLGESYMEGWWDCEAIDEFIFRILHADLDPEIAKHKEFLFALMIEKLRFWQGLFFNRQTQAKAIEAGQRHYDIGNDLYQAMLGKSLNYTCGYWKNAQNLDDAQVAKMDLTCRKLYLEPGMRVLDIGCGFGAFAEYAAKNYGVSVVGVTVSKQQHLLAQELCKGLPIDIRLQDYRELGDKFDRIVSLGMFEHVGVKNYQTYMRVASECLKNDGIFLLHTIGTYQTQTQIDPWLDRYIFPRAALPSVAQIGKAIEPFFIVEDWHNFGPDYARTLRAWHANFVAHWPELKTKYSNTFYRMWTYYLQASAGGFMAKVDQLWQIVLTKTSRLEPYVSIR